MKYIFALLFFLSSLTASMIHIVFVPNCPYSCASDTNQKGFLVDTITYIFEKAGYDVVSTFSSSHQEAFTDVKNGKFDLLIDTHLQKEKQLIYMKKPMGYTHNLIVVPKYSKWKYTSVNSLKELHLAAIKELTYNKEINNYLLQYKNNPTKVQIASGHLARKRNLKKLKFDKVNALIDDRVSLRYFYHKTKKPFAFKIAYTSKPKPIEIAFSPKSYRSKKYQELLYKELKRLKGSQKIEEIMQIYGLSEAYIRPSNPIP